MSAAPIRTSSGQLLGAVATLVDITEQREASKALRESDEQLRLAAEAAEFRVLKSDGVYGWVMLRGRASLTGSLPDNQSYRLEGVIMDITKRKEAEIELHRLSTRLSEISENDNLRFSQDLHDEIGQNLTAINLLLILVRGALPESTSGFAIEKLDEAINLSKDTTTAVREIVQNLRPSVLDDLGLLAALKWYGSHVASRTDIKVQVCGDYSTAALTRSAEMAMYRIAQEAMTNTVKHALATNIVVTIQMTPMKFQMIISDDGVGFVQNHEQTKENHGWGLMIMRERALAAGGEMVVQSEPGRGTQITVIIYSDKSS